MRLLGRWVYRRKDDRATTFLGRLARDVRGNTIAIMAAALIPLAGMVGGGIDISRMYITKTRLQHACDAGALAGRKAMGGGVWGTDDNAKALQFFDDNFGDGTYGSTGRTRTFTENAGTVTGAASAVLPMTLMRVMGFTTQTIAVTCDAAMRLPNTDVMFVLDTTGSMNCPAASTTCTNNNGIPAAGSKIDGLKTAVKCFYEIVARLDTDATCATGTPSGGTGDQVQIRFGFMPYSSNVNVGRQLPSSYFADSWKYQSREARWWVVTSTSTTTGSGQTTNTAKSACTDANASAYNSSSDSVSGDTKTNTSTTYKISTSRAWNSANGGTCYYDSTTTKTNYGKTTTYTAGAGFADWHYGQITTSLAGLKSGTGWNAGLPLRIDGNGGMTTVNWDGCIEERPTVQTTNYNPIPANAYDLNIDLVPAAGNANSLWGPALGDLIYLRQIQNYYSQANTADAYTTGDFYQPGSYCPTEARKLQSWPDANDFDNYVDSLVASGNTYHDIGMLWGARFMSPDGIFASENKTTKLGADIERHMIFMTDGDSTSSPCDYNAYGVPWFDKRQVANPGTAANCGTNNQDLINQINYRLDALCTAVKNKNITLWVISFGNGSNAATEARLKSCATDSRFFTARDSVTLQQTFASIANQISQLRLTQ